MPSSVFSIKPQQGRWFVSPPPNLKESCEFALAQSKYQAIEAAREVAISVAPAIIEVFSVSGTLDERIFIDAK